MAVSQRRVYTELVQRLTGMALLAAVPVFAQTIENLDPPGLNSPTSAAKPGALLRLSLDGDHRKAQLRIGNVALAIQRRKQHNGKTELTFRLPDNVIEGCFVPVHVIESGAFLPNSIPAAISGTGACQPPAYQFSASWLRRRMAIVSRIHTTGWSLENAGETHTVAITGAFFEGDSTIVRPGALLRFPPPGHCSSRSGSYPPGTARIDILLPLLIDDIAGKELDAGSSIYVDDGRAQMSIPQVIGRSAIFWRTVFNSQNDYRSIDTSGNLRVRASGGDVGSFAATLSPPDRFVWTGRPNSPVVLLSRNVAISWQAATPGWVLLATMAYDGATEFAYCLCLADAGVRRFELPAPVLRSLVDATSHKKRETGGALYLIHIPQDVPRVSTERLDRAFGLSLQMHSADVVLQH